MYITEHPDICRAKLAKIMFDYKLDEEVINMIIDNVFAQVEVSLETFKRISKLDAVVTLEPIDK